MKAKPVDFIYPEYWKYLISDLSWCDSFLHKLQVIICRIKGHPAGVVWYSQGFEPDMHCRNCGDEV